MLLFFKTIICFNSLIKVKYLMQIAFKEHFDIINIFRKFIIVREKFDMITQLLNYSKYFNILFYSEEPNIKIFLFIF